MNHFEIVGWSTPTLATACERLLSIQKLLTDSCERFAIEAHGEDFDAIRAIAKEAPSDVCAIYCWATITHGVDLESQSFATLRRANLAFKNAAIAMTDAGGLPPYDWDGRVPLCSIISLTTIHPLPLSPSEKEPSSDIANFLAQVGAEMVDESLEAIKVSTSWKESSREHSYSLKIPRRKAMAAISRICSGLSLLEGKGSFEFVGTIDQLDGVYQNPLFQTDNFPKECGNLNYPPDTSFSFGTTAYLLPVPILQPSQLLKVAAIIDDLGKKINYRCVVGKYQSWKIGEGVRSRKVQENYLLVSRQNSSDYSIFLGFERYSDEDPSARNFTLFVEPLLAQIGVRLKKVSGPR